MKIWIPDPGHTPERMAYGLARFSRSPDSLEESLEWINRKSAKGNADASRFMDTFYFDYGHASVADLGHMPVSLEGISLLAAVEVEDEQVWDGQEKSTRYQKFGDGDCVVIPRCVTDAGEAAVKLFKVLANDQLAAYRRVHEWSVEDLKEKHPFPKRLASDVDTYERNINARAFDIARYFLPMGIKTNVGQVVSIRTLERQIGRLLVSPFQECRDLAEELKKACAEDHAAPTLAKRAKPNVALDTMRRIAKARADELSGKLNYAGYSSPRLTVELLKAQPSSVDIVAGLLFTSSSVAWEACSKVSMDMSETERLGFIQDAILTPRGGRGDMPRVCNVGYAYNFEISMDFGGFRDMHRHRRCQQIIQPQDWRYETWVKKPDFMFLDPCVQVIDEFVECQRGRHRAVNELASLINDDEKSNEACKYLMPLGHCMRSVFRMDLAQVQYITKLRTGVKGHPSYRRIAYGMAQAVRNSGDPLGVMFTEATPPSFEEPLIR